MMNTNLQDHDKIRNAYISSAGFSSKKAMKG